MLKMYPATSLSGNKPTTMKNCPLCFKEFNEENSQATASPNPKMYELCSRYLHSSLTEEALINQCNSTGQHAPFCSKCFESAMQLVILSDQMEFIQKSVSDVVLMFSLDILHRRGHSMKDGGGYDPTNNISSKKQLVEIDVSTLPNSERWNIPTSFNNENALMHAHIPVTSSSEFQGIISENISTTQISDPDPLSFNECPTNNSGENGFTVQNIKCEDTLWIDESEEIVNENSDFELPFQREEALPSFPTTHIVIPEQTPVVKLHRLKFENSARNVVTYDGDNVKDFENQEGKTRETILTKSNSGSDYSYSLRGMSKTTTYEQSNVDFVHFPSSSKILKLNTKTATASSSTSQIAGKSRLPRLLKCDICNEVLKGKRLLLLHKRKHKDELCFKCDFCNKGFKQKNLMRNHRRLHTGEKPFVCSVCTKSFASQNCLRFHILMYHTKEKPFKCEICGKGFVQRWLLERHRTVHTGGRKYNCDQCDYSTTQQLQLKTHKTKTHPNVSNNLKCRECGIDFETSDLVEEHFKSVHFALDFADDCIIENT